MEDTSSNQPADEAAPINPPQTAENSSLSAETPAVSPDAPTWPPVLDQSSGDASQGGPITTPATSAADAPATAPESQAPPVQTQPAPVLSPQTSAAESSKPNFISQLLQNARKKIQERKQVRLQKILALAQNKGAATNDNIEKLLRMSDKTAERYLSKLVGQGRLKKAGSTSQIRYELPK